MAKLTGILAGLTVSFYFAAAFYGVNPHGGFGLFILLGLFGLSCATIVSLIVWGLKTVIRNNRSEP
jgi:hypothetical protein